QKKWVPLDGIIGAPPAKLRGKIVSKTNDYYSVGEYNGMNGYADHEYKSGAAGGGGGRYGGNGNGNLPRNRSQRRGERANGPGSRGAGNPSGSNTVAVSNVINSNSNDDNHRFAAGNASAGNKVGPSNFPNSSSAPRGGGLIGGGGRNLNRSRSQMSNESIVPVVNPVIVQQQTNGNVGAIPGATVTATMQPPPQPTVATNTVASAVTGVTAPNIHPDEYAAAA
ncbi:hypothetical protein BLA29_007076, partial [Euroglyphus maynei]